MKRELCIRNKGREAGDKVTNDCSSSLYRHQSASRSLSLHLPCLMCTGGVTGIFFFFFFKVQHQTTPICCSLESKNLHSFWVTSLYTHTQLMGRGEQGNIERTMKLQNFLRWWHPRENEATHCFRSQLIKGVHDLFTTFYNMSTHQTTSSPSE